MSKLLRFGSGPTMPRLLEVAATGSSELRAQACACSDPAPGEF